MNLDRKTNNECQKRMEDEFKATQERRLIKGEIKEFLCACQWFDSIQIAESILSDNHVFRYHFKANKDQSDDIVNECIKLIYGIRLLVTVHGALRLNDPSRILKIAPKHPLFVTGMIIEYDDITGTLGIISEITPCNDKDYLKLGYILLMRYFTDYFSKLQTKCVPTKLETICRRLATYSVVGGIDSLEVYFDDQELVRLDNELTKTKIATRQREILKKKKDIYEKYINGTNLFSEDAKKFLDYYGEANQTLLLSEPFWDIKKYETTFCGTICSWKSVINMIDSLRSMSSLKISYQQNIWTEIDSESPHDLKKVQAAQIQTILIAKILLTSLANKTIENGYYFHFKLIPDVENEWDFANNARYEIITTKDSCTIYTNKLRYIDETNSFIRNLPDYPDKQYIYPMLEALSHSIDFVMAWLFEQDNSLLITSYCKAIAAY